MASWTTTVQMAAPVAHGIKRRAGDALEGEQRLSKRFNLMNLGATGKLYIPVAGTAGTAHSDQQQPGHDSATCIPFTDRPSVAAAAIAGPAAPATASPYMDVDNTPTRTYIYDLDAELAAAEPELGVDGASCPDHHQQQQQQLVFIPDIEKHLNKLPEQLLRGRLLSSTLGGGDDAVSSNSQLVLYSEPTSLSVPPERDSVRKAVVEARQRMRERQAIGGYVAPTPLLTAPEQSTHAHKTDRGLDAAAGQTWQWPGWPHFDSIAYTPAESRIVDEMDVS